MPDLAAARRSLEALALGDAYGERHCRLAPSSVDVLEPGPWTWTDDTHMAHSIYEVLESHGRIDQDQLAAAFARRFHENPFRGYAGGAAYILRRLNDGLDWRELVTVMFPGGSYGNGAAMRVAPLGAYYVGDPVTAASEAELSAAVTHAHLEGRAGAIAVAAATALLPGLAMADPAEQLDAFAAHVPGSLTRDGVLGARAIAGDDFAQAVRTLGCGHDVSAQDTVPFCLWMVANFGDDLAFALWLTARAGGDADTTCAIVGGILGPVAELPAEWLARREPLEI